jgi:tetratricopeptide (TPR) repeat protein
MMQRLRGIGLALFTTLAICGAAGQASAADSFELTSIKAVRPTLVNTLNALQQKDIAKAKDAFEAYDGAWNGIEVYINTRSKDMYNAIELELQDRITKELNAPTPDYPKLVADTQAIIGKYDEAIAMVANGKPLNPLYDDVARLRIVRAPLRVVVPALKAGNIAKARKSYEEFDSKWDSIEDLIKARSEDAYVAIEKGMIQIEQALMPDKPDVAQVTSLVQALNMQYNGALAEIVKEARK